MKTVRGVSMMGMMGLAGVAQGFDLQGHRGARGLMPENTLPGFTAALAIGVSTLELDLGVTADSHVVVMHDPRFEPKLARDQNGNWLQRASAGINTMTLEQVRVYDVGRLNPERKYATRFPDQQALDGIRVPTLAEVFELVEKSGNRDVRFNIEIKINPEKPEQTLAPKQFAQAVIRVIEAHGMANRVSIQSFDWRALQLVQDMAPGVTTSYLSASQNWLNNLQPGVAGASPWLGGLDIDVFDGSAACAIKAAGGNIWSAYHREVSVESIALAHGLGLEVNVWTVNDSGRMRELIAMGVDGIITDYPDRLRQILADLDLPLPAATPAPN